MAVDFSGDRMALKRLAAKVAETNETRLQQAEVQYEQKKRQRQATADYYVEQNGTRLLWIAIAVLLLGGMLLWLNECAQREERVRLAALNVLKRYGNDPDMLKESNIREAVMAAEERLDKSLLFSVLCRTIRDSFMVTTVSDYESVFRRAVESAMQQHWFMAAITVTVIVAFLAAVVSLFYLSCTPRLWRDGTAARKKQK